MAIACGGAIAANAAEKYPENSSFTKHAEFSDGISDFAAGDGGFAFAHGNFITVIKEDKRFDYSHTSAVKAVEFAEGTFYFLDSADACYSLPDKAPAEGVTFQSDGDGGNGEKEIKTAEYIYLLLTGSNELWYRQVGTASLSQISGTFSHLKLYGGEAYAMKEGEVLRLNGASTDKISGADGTLTYKDYSETGDIDVPASFADDVKTPHLEFVTINAGAYYTRVYIDGAASGKFRVDEESTKPAAGGELALLICRTGGSAIISIGDECYILLEGSVTTSPQEGAKVAMPEGSRGSMLEPIIYSTPFATSGTRIGAYTAGKSVKLVSKISSNVLQFGFYEVEYDDGTGKTVKGYMPEGYLLVGFEYADDENPNITPTPKEDYSEENAIKTVLLIVIIAALLLAAIGYVIFVATSDKRKKSGKVKTEDPTPRDPEK